MTNDWRSLRTAVARMSVVHEEFGDPPTDGFVQFAEQRCS
jgi:hypothetical protein